MKPGYFCCFGGGNRGLEASLLQYTAIQIVISHSVPNLLFLRFFVNFGAGSSVQLFVNQLIGQGLRSFWARSVFYGQALPIHYGLRRTVW